MPLLPLELFTAFHEGVETVSWHPVVAQKLEGREICEKNGFGEDVVTISIMDTSKLTIMLVHSTFKSEHNEFEY